MSTPIRVLHVVTVMDRNGLESRIMDIYRNIDRTKIQFDFLTHREREGQFDKEIQSLGGKMYRMPAIHPTHFFGYLKNLQRFFHAHKEYRIVHAHLNSYCTWVLAIAKKNGVPVRIAHSRNSGMDHDWKAIFKYFSKLWVNIPTTHKFACSKQAGVWLFGKRGIQPPNDFRVISNAFDLEKFRYSKEKRREMRKYLGLTEEKAYVHVGRLTYQKNHKFLFDIFENILKEQPQAKLFLLGEGELREELVQLARSKKIDHAVVFLGNQKNVGAYLQAMDMMIFPSVYEGFGTVVIETQCIGIPTLASDVLPADTKITEIMEFMSVKHDSPKQWAQKAMEMAETPRRSFEAEVKAAGYCIQETYAALSQFYLDVYRSSEANIQ